MKIGLSAGAYFGMCETEEALMRMSHLPLDTCEVFLSSPSEYTQRFATRALYQLDTLPVTSIHPLGTQFEAQLFSPSQRQTQDAFAVFEQVCAVAPRLKAEYYIFHGPYSVYGHMPPEKIRFLEERFPAMQAIAAKNGLTILWENVFWCALARPEEVRTLLARVPDLSFVLDLKQALRANVDPFQMLSAMSGRVRHLHVLDWTADGHLALPGRGCFDWKRLHRVLQDEGFDGAIIIEPYAALVENEDALKESIAFLRDVFSCPCSYTPSAIL